MYEAFIAWFSLFLIAYIFGGYWVVLRLISRFSFRDQEKSTGFDDSELPTLSVLVTVFNEESIIEDRIQNILACTYPEEKLQVIIASDGSTDQTDQVVRRCDDPRVVLFRPEKRSGKTDTQNQAIEKATGQILVFSDADTRFDKGFLMAIIQPFADPSVGGVDGHLLFKSDRGSSISESQGAYWSQELAIRGLESRLGVLAVSSGACLAIRKSLFRPMTTTVGEDCIVPLDIVGQGYRMVHCKDALAYDQMPSDEAGEFRTRIRMTMRNWQGTLQFASLLNPVKNPGVALALWSHKILRWLSPFFLITWILSGILSLDSGFPWSIAGWLALVFVGAAFFGWTSNRMGLKLPVFGTVYSFCLANAGFFIGTIKALRGHAVTVYK